MRKSVFARVTTVLTSAAMAIAAAAFTTTAGAASAYSIQLTDAETLAGKVVNVDINLKSNNQCEGYTIAVEFDEALEFRRVNGGASYSVDDGILYISGFTPTAFQDGKVGSISFVAPADAMKGETYEVNIAKVEKFGTMDEDIFDGTTTENCEVTVLEKAAKTSTYMVFVSETPNGIESSIGIRGDFGGDGAVDIFDAVNIAKIASSKNPKCTAVSMFFGDVNEDGSLDIFDAVLVARFTSGNNWNKLMK